MSIESNNKRVATKFRRSEDDWENDPNVLADIQYIEDHLDTPENYSLEYSDWFDYHIGVAFEKKYRIENGVLSEHGDFRHEISLLSDYCDKVIGTDVEQFALTLMDEIMHRCIAVGDIDDFFTWMDRKGEVKCSCSPHDVFQDDHVSMKYIYHRPIYQFRELLGAYGYTKSSPELTKFGKDNEQDILIEAQRLYEELDNPYIVESFVPKVHEKYSSMFDVQYPNVCKAPHRPYCLCLYTNKDFIKFIKKMLRDAENNVRERQNISKVGEGWVAETQLYNAIKESYPLKDVIHGYRSKWLGLQHLDIFIEKENIAIEYQGEQHFKSIERFGGSDAVALNKKRDAAKKEKCQKNGVHLIWVCEDYNVDELKRLIDDIVSQKPSPDFYVMGNRKKK